MNDSAYSSSNSEQKENYQPNFERELSGDNFSSSITSNDNTLFEHDFDFIDDFCGHHF